MGLAARLGGGVGELALAMLMLQPGDGGRRGRSRAACAAHRDVRNLARKLVHEVEISTAECCDALADLLSDCHRVHVGIVTRLDWRVGTDADCQAFADGLFDCANETAAVQSTGWSGRVKGLQAWYIS